MASHPVHFLILLVPFAGNEDNVAFPGHHAGCADSLTAVGDADSVTKLFRGETRLHVVEDAFGILAAGIVGCEHQLVAALRGYLRHLGAFGLVAVAAASHHGDELLILSADIVDGAYHVLEGIGSVGIVDDGGDALAADVLETAGSGLEERQQTHRFGGLDARQHGGTVDGQEVVGVEASHQAAPQFVAVDIQMHPFEAFLQHPAMEIAQVVQAVGVHLGAGVLHHHPAVPVVDIGESPCRRGEGVEEALLGGDVVGHRLVEVEVVVGDVAENGTGEFQTCYALLHHGMRAHLHETEPASRLHHAAQQPVEL